MKKALVLLAVLAASASCFATLTPVILNSDGPVKYSFSLKGTTGESTVEAIESSHCAFVYLYNRYNVVCSGFRLEPDKKGKKYMGGISSEGFTYTPKKGAWKYAADNVNSSFTLGSYNSQGALIYTSTFDSKGKAKASGTLADDITSELGTTGKYFGLACVDDAGDGCILDGSYVKMEGKEGKSWKGALKSDDGTSCKISLKCKSKAISISYKTSTRVVPCFVED